jgi:hypothetical protein
LVAHTAIANGRVQVLNWTSGASCSTPLIATCTIAIWIKAADVVCVIVAMREVAFQCAVRVAIVVRDASVASIRGRICWRGVGVWRANVASWAAPESITSAVTTSARIAGHVCCV